MLVVRYLIVAVMIAAAAVAAALWHGYSVLHALGVVLAVTVVLQGLIVAYVAFAAWRGGRRQGRGKLPSHSGQAPLAKKRVPKLRNQLFILPK